jgi:hypothetical protein
MAMVSFHPVSGTSRMGVDFGDVDGMVNPWLRSVRLKLTSD